MEKSGSEASVRANMGFSRESELPPKKRALDRGKSILDESEENNIEIESNSSKLASIPFGIGEISITNLETVLPNQTEPPERPDDVEFENKEINEPLSIILHPQNGEKEESSNTQEFMSPPPPPPPPTPPPPQPQLQSPPRHNVCKFCGQRFSTSQALGGHQNAHKHEREVQRALMAAHNNPFTPHSCGSSIEPLFYGPHFGCTHSYQGYASRGWHTNTVYPNYRLNLGPTQTSATPTLSQDFVQSQPSVTQVLFQAQPCVGQGLFRAQPSVTQGLFRAQPSAAQSLVRAQYSVAQGLVRAQNGQALVRVQPNVGHGLVRTQNSLGQGLVRAQNSLGQGLVRAQNSLGQLVRAQTSVGQGLVRAQPSVGQDLVQVEPGVAQSLVFGKPSHAQRLVPSQPSHGQGAGPSEPSHGQGDGPSEPSHGKVVVRSHGLEDLIGQSSMKPETLKFNPGWPTPYVGPSGQVRVTGFNPYANSNLASFMQERENEGNPSQGKTMCRMVQI